MRSVMNENRRTDVAGGARSHTHRLGLSRREVLQVGYSGLLGMGLPSLLQGRVNTAKACSAAAKSPRSVILIFLTGAPSHLAMFDLISEAPAEIRGEYKPIASRTVGLQ